MPIIMPWGAGGATDIIIRIFAVGFRKEMSQPMNVVNRTGSAGVVGHSAIANGYTLGACTSVITHFETMRLMDLTPASDDLISRLATLPARLTVAADSSYGSVEETIEAAKPDELSASGSGLRARWHMDLTGMIEASGVAADTVNLIPSKGGASASGYDRWRYRHVHRTPDQGPCAC